MQNMEHNIDAQLAANMIMCGDHPSVTKTELNAKESKAEAKDKDAKKFIYYGRVTPTVSRTEHGERGEHGERAGAGAAAGSEHALRRPVRRADRADVQSRALVQAALGSFRWPPYLLCAWLLVLLLTHALHCLVAMLERAIPTLRKFCQYFRTWTEESWKAESDFNQRMCPIALACATGTLYALYAALYVVYSVCVWAVEPLCSDVDDVSVAEMPKVTDYTDEVNSKIDLNLKQ